MPAKREPYLSLYAVFNQYYNSLCFFANRIINDQPAAEDIVEDLFLRLWEKEPDFNQHKNLKAALYIGVKNACLDYIKKQKNLRSKTNALTYLLQQEQEDYVLNEITRAEVLREVYTEMQKLPPECRKVMQLYYRHGLDHKNISAKLGVTVSTVKNQKARGLKILKKKLGTSFLYFLVLFG
ncbi:RNA polymerase sigma-70 factor [Agriterribacter sp.]|uniref:RNA polymerase sigma-70 factor n=1 Tax=Agriterribacter sp. TaxID=2821509 RepID=UPI002C0D1FB0|nr:RNA polymerase sigma-70 factor [Agriterribacter sp.]HTN05987.1 RNA polymerase sigma-70 factor [Agriterribacter sp.]